MKDSPAEDRRLVRVSTICLALPEASRWYNGQHARFHVREKTFGYYLDDHHGDGIVSFSCKVAVGENEELAAMDPARFYVPGYTGPKGWVALRLDVGAVDWEEVAELALESYCLIAPKRLAERARANP